ncbi:MAG TPA: signal peptidase I [Candidatus Saccharimonadales bacterium]|nr:signal peptidase I [Candidatus Saccharimonadales bacterium]
MMNPEKPDMATVDPAPNPPVTPATTPAEANTLPAGRQSALRIFSGWLFSWFILPIALVLFLHLFVFQAFHVVGSSMVNTLHDQDYLIISKVDHTVANLQGKDYIPARQSIIVFHYPKQPDLIFVKRVIGLPGERVVVRDGQVRVYNPSHPEGFDPNTGYEPDGTQTLIDTDVTVPNHTLFVLGDNRTPGGSSDSRDWGFLPADNIIGNAVLRLFPFDQIRGL